MICSSCATELPAGAMFCGECGRPVAVRASRASVERTRSEEAADELILPAEREPMVASADWHEPQQVAAPSEEPVPEPESVPDPEPAASAPEPREDDNDDGGGGAGWCAQCGALLASSDIFCGECGFVRSPTARARDTVALDPFPWGAPLEPEVVPAPSAVPAPNPIPDEAPDDDLDDTRIVAPGARGDRFILQFSTGESFSVTGAGLLGRNPMPEPGEYFDSLVTISDPGKSVSKTHLEFGQESGSFWISDRYSGNGTVIREPDRQARRCEPGKRYRIVRGTRVDIGEQFFVVS